MDINKKIALTEGLLFLSGDAGASVSDIKTLLGMKSSSEVTKIINSLIKKYQNDKFSGLDIQNFAGDKYRMIVKKENYNYYLKLENVKLEAKLSPASLEVLSIIAYKSPISKAQIEDIRGVNCDGVIYKLRLRNLIHEIGRSEGPGRPILFGVTDEFMKYFNINSLDELPALKEIKEVDNEDKDIFAANRDK
ncbi:SMC-Scp complex subunit ScpB [Spiroplasma endosymbiont of Crioceris asparagi]|uniref:SMC-Scp complex subunit ScpB n=1 Tax=Spiroplasma endosymbiont of Crioceris asparagi TaxID=3066286 RepID=UPI0030CFA010